MDAKRRIRVRISHQRIEALGEICADMLEGFSPADAHQELLREYLLELQEKLQQMMRRGQELYTLTLVGSEAIAFYQLWHLVGMTRDKYALLIVDNLLKKISVAA